MLVGVIGAGYWGKKIVSESIGLGMNVIVADLLDENLAYFRGKSNVETTKDYRELLSRKNVTSVHICVPNELHYKICREALESGKHVLLEKPMTLDYRQARELADLSRRKGLTLNVGHIFRFNNAIKKAKELHDSGFFGDVYLVNLRWTNIERVLTDRDIIFDLGPHPFDIVNYIFGKNPDSIFCMAQGYRQKNEEAAFISCRMGKAMVNFELSWITPEKIRSLAIVGSKKAIFVDCLNQTIQTTEPGEIKRSEIKITPNNTIKDELEEFFRCIKTKSSSKSDGYVGAEIVRILEKARESVITKKMVAV